MKQVFKIFTRIFQGLNIHSGPQLCKYFDLMHQKAVMPWNMGSEACLPTELPKAVSLSTVQQRQSEHREVSMDGEGRKPGQRHDLSYQLLTWGAISHLSGDSRMPRCAQPQDSRLPASLIRLAMAAALCSAHDLPQGPIQNPDKLPSIPSPGLAACWGVCWLLGRLSVHMGMLRWLKLSM